MPRDAARRNARAEKFSARYDRHVPFSIRYGNTWKRLGWRVKNGREAVALWLAPWLRRKKF